jgi:hypothetical protein
MSLRRLEGFDGLNNIDELTSLRGGEVVLSSGTGMKYSASGGRNGNGAIYHDVTGSTAARYVQLKAVSGTDVSAGPFVLGFAFKIVRGTFDPVTSSVPHPLFQVVTATGAEVGSAAIVKIGTLWYLRWFNGTTARSLHIMPGTDSNYFPVDDLWYYLECKITLATTAIGSIEWFVNGIQAGTTTTGVITAAIGTTMTRLQLNRGAGSSTNSSTNLVSGQQIWYDDVYWLSTAGGGHDDYLGDVRVDYVPAASEGFHTDSTPLSGSDRALMVDDVPQDGDTTYNTFVGVGARDTFVLDSLPAAGMTVVAVQPQAVLRNAGDQARTFNTCVRWDGVDYDHNAAANYLLTPGSTYAGLWGSFTETIVRNPDTSANWTQAELATAEFGVYVVG